MIIARPSNEINLSDDPMVSTTRNTRIAATTAVELIHLNHLLTKMYNNQYL